VRFPGFPGDTPHVGSDGWETAIRLAFEASGFLSSRGRKKMGPSSGTGNLSPFAPDALRTRDAL